MNTLTNQPYFGTQQLAASTLTILIETLNDAMEDLADGDQADILPSIQVLRGQVDAGDEEPVVLEPVELENFYLGHQPSLINAPVDKYPNVSVMADRAGPAPIDDYDHVSIYRLRLWVEFMVKSEVGEEEVNARVQMMAEAVNTCLMSNRTFLGNFNEYGGTPDVQFTEAFLRKEKTAYGDTWTWQGGRIEYDVQKEAAMPAGSFSRPVGASAPVGADFDQS